MFCIVLDLGGICLRGLLSLFAFQLPSGVANLNVVGLFVMLGWAASCCIGKATSDESWQADMMIIIKESIFASRQNE